MRPLFSQRSSSFSLSRWGVTVLLFGLCSLVGLGLSLVHQSVSAPVQAQVTVAENDDQGVDMGTAAVGTIDPIPAQYQLGADLYLDNCATCHIGVPPQVLPLQTWQQLLQDSEHYGVRIPPLVDPPRLLIWQYLRHFSRSIKEPEAIPYHVAESRYFKALHPRVEFAEDVGLRQCISCHPGASNYNFRQLTAEWVDAP